MMSAVTMTSRPIAFWRRLSDHHQHPVRHLGWALLADLPVTVAIGFLLNGLTGTTWPEFPADSLPRILVAMCVVAPLLETAGLAVIIWILQRVGLRPALVPLVAALVCAALHSLVKPLWGLEIFWAFLIFSLCYVTWARKSVWSALGLTALLHALHNLLPLLALLIGRVAQP
jgi:hypothetical protein